VNGLVPSTVRQAWWMVAGGVLALILAAMRGYAFYTHGGVVILALCLMFAGLGALSIAASVKRIRLGDNRGT
jgi:hypothetical protein